MDMEDENPQDFENMRGDLDHHHLLGIWNKKTNKQGKFYMLEAWNLVPTLLASILQIRGEKKECV